MLGTSIRALPRTKDPAADLVEAGVAVFRSFAIGHPSLFKIAVQQTIGSPGLAAEFTNAAAAAFEGLQVNVSRLRDAGQLGDRSVRDAASEFHALCEGLAALELRGRLGAGDSERIWRDALGAIVVGFSVPARRQPPKRRRSAAAVAG
jgi:Tetracyclin repressor-like, C-terminal domain